jgi:hypothetical protein
MKKTQIASEHDERSMYVLVTYYEITPEDTLGKKLGWAAYDWQSNEMKIPAGLQCSIPCPRTVRDGNDIKMSPFPVISERAEAKPRKSRTKPKYGFEQE